ncbi:MAG TPA: 4'-phosphopantetheinyl transferase superfamily protein [Thermoanaerobaculia bacterium]
MKIVEIPPEWRRRAIVVRAEPLPLWWFSTEELRAAERFKLDRRRDDFLLSRAAAKSLAMELGLARDPMEIRVEGRQIATRNVSLSHSSPYAAAAIDERPVGIDAQVIRDISENAAHLFLTDAEIETMRSIDVPDRLIHFWCAKEAVWKREGGSIATLRRVPLALEAVNETSLHFEDVDTLRLGDLVVALTRRVS